MHNRRLFVTEDGTVGLAPNETIESDILCVLRDALSPVILRQRVNNGWTLVCGDCEVAGILSDTNDQNRRSDYVDIHHGSEEEFVIW